MVQATNNNAYEKSVGRYSVAFREDGTAFTGIPNLKVSASIDGSEVTADRLNAYPDANLSMLTDDYADKTYWNTGFAHDIIVLEADGKRRLTSRYPAVLKAILNRYGNRYPLKKIIFILSRPPVIRVFQRQLRESSQVLRAAQQFQTLRVAGQT